MSRQLQLYRNLSALANDEDSPFFLIEHIGPSDGATYHVFSYRLGSYQDFLRPDALECRGHMFRIDNDGPVLVSAPFPKFFNRNENPMTMDLDFSISNVDYIANKEDGSLITTYLDANGDLQLKSKTSLTSTMAQESMELLPTIKAPFAQRPLLDYCHALENSGHTVIMEYVSPKNRIVLPYAKCNLVVLGVRNRDTLEMWNYDDFRSTGLDEYAAPNVLNFVLMKYDCTSDFVNQIHARKGIEGYVIRLKDGTMVKCKTDEYVSLHHAKDSVTSPRRLMNVILEEASDDLKQMFVDDEQALREIENMECFVSDTVNHLVKPVDNFFRANKELGRKDYAIKGQQELRKDQFSLAMALYSGKPIDYKSFIAKNYKAYLENYKSTLDNVKEE